MKTPFVKTFKRFKIKFLLIFSKKLFYLYIIYDIIYVTIFIRRTIMNNKKLSYLIESDDFVNMGHVSDDVQKQLREMNFPAEIVRRVSTVLYQGEINMLIHAGGGEIIIDINDECITMTLTDKGPGIEDIEAALSEGYSTAGPRAKSLGFGEGMGFSSMKKYSDDMEIYSEPGVGTTLIMKVFVRDEE